VKRTRLQSVEAEAVATPARPRLRLVATERPQVGRDEAIPFAFSLVQLELIHRSLQAARTLGVLPYQDELLGDLIDSVDLALREAV
jgi:hypothetical protein